MAIYAPLFGAWLRDKREVKGYTGREVGKKLGVPKQSISGWETGEGSPPSIINLCKLTDVLGVSLKEMLKQLEPEDPKKVSEAKFLEDFFTKRQK